MCVCVCLCVTGLPLSSLHFLVPEHVNSFEALCPYPHKNIVTAYGICTDAPDGQLRIVMELCTKSVWQLLDEHRVRVGQLILRGGFFRCL